MPPQDEKPTPAPAEKPPVVVLPDDKTGRRSLIILGTIAVALLVYYVLPRDMNELARRTVALFVIAAIFWATEVIPLFATSLCIIALEILLLAHTGGLAPIVTVPGADETAAPRELALSFQDFLNPFSSSVIILFLGGFLLSAAVTKHGIDRAIAARLLKPFTRGPALLLYAVLGITAVFSMWMSNTATTAMMLAIIAPVLRSLPPEDKFHRAIVLAVPFGANIGGIGTPIGTPPNAVALASLRRAGFEISFLDWTIMALPLAVLLLAVVGVVLYLFFRPGPGLVIPPVEPTRRIGGKAALTVAVLLGAIALWLSSEWHGVNSAVIALIAAAALTALGVLDKRDVDSIDWNILILMWGGLSLGNAMEQTELVNYIVQLPIAELTGFLLALVIVLLAVTLSTFMSNTATVNLIVPMVLALATGAQAVQLVVLAALACSMAMAMPVSTPPNAMAFATGRVPVTSLMRAGAMTSLIAVFILLLGYQLAMPVFLRMVVTP